MEPISNLKKLRDICHTLYGYRIKSVEPDFGDIAYVKDELDGEINFKTSPR